MRIGSGEFTYEWIEDFAEIPDREAAKRGWAHHGMALTASGTLVTFHPANPTVLELSRDGALLRRWDLPIREAHGITICSDGSKECLWVADIGRKRDPDQGYDFNWGPKAGHVIKTALDGMTEMELVLPELPIYKPGTYSPTQVAVYASGDGGDDDVWVTDGYGQNHIHRFTKGGEYVASINGDEGKAGAFACPHAIWIDTRKAEPELYIADRSNARIQVYDLEGRYKRSFGSDFLISPTAFARVGEHLVVAELHARLAVLDLDDKLVMYLGDNHEVGDEPGWPNMLDGDGVPMRTNRLRPGKFNGPHALAADAEGNLYVSEWLIGGRYIKLAKV